jgi:hypothetical protein
MGGLMHQERNALLRIVMMTSVCGAILALPTRAQAHPVPGWQPVVLDEYNDQIGRNASCFVFEASYANGPIRVTTAHGLLGAVFVGIDQYNRQIGRNAPCLGSRFIPDGTLATALDGWWPNFAGADEYNSRIARKVFCIAAEVSFAGVDQYNGKIAQNMPCAGLHLSSPTIVQVPEPAIEKSWARGSIPSHPKANSLRAISRPAAPSRTSR